jgi:hypothetical protein
MVILKKRPVKGRLYFWWSPFFMFIAYTAGASNGFKKWLAAHPAAKKHASQSNEAAPIVPAVADAGSPQAESARSPRPMTYYSIPPSSYDGPCGFGRLPKLLLLVSP